MSATSTSTGSTVGAAAPTLCVVLAGVVLVAMSISGTAVALPSIGNDLGTAGSPLNWVVAGYNLAFAAMTLVAGSAADRIGRRRVFVVAATVFAIGFLGAAAGRSIVVVDVARIVSGAGGAGIMAAGGALLASAYDGVARHRAFALMGTMAGVGIASGPTLSGLLVTAAGWRGSFGVFAAIGLLIAGAAIRGPESRSPGGSTDWLGSLLFVAALSALMYAVLEAPGVGWAAPRIVTAFVVALLALSAFVIVQRRTKSPVLSPALMANRGFLGWSFATLTTSIGFLGVLVFLPTYLQAAAGLSPAAAGLAMLLLTAPVLLVPMIAVSLVNKGISARAVILIALASVVCGNLSLTVVRPGNTVAVVAVPLLLIGIGMGASFGITDGQAMSLVPATSVGMAAGFLNTLRGAAEALVIAGFSASLLGLLGTKLDAGRAQAAAVSSGHLGDQAAAELDAFTWSWQVTQIGISAVCLVLSVAVAALILGDRSSS
ncbi:MFS transporter [Kribbella sp. NPDC054772]